MAGARRGRQVIRSEAVAGRRSTAVLVLALIVVLAAIFLIWNVARQSFRHAAVPSTQVVPAAEPPAAGPEPTTAAAVSPAPADEGVASARDQAEIGRVISDGRPGLRNCYQRALVRDESLVNGKVTVRLSIGASGRVDTVRVSGPPEFRTLQPCFEETISRWTFPTAAAPYAAEFPLVLQGRQ